MALMHGAELEQLRKEVLEMRRAELTRVLDDPDGADWPEAFLQPGRTKRGDSGVALRELAQALVCTSQALSLLSPLTSTTQRCSTNSGITPKSLRHESAESRSSQTRSALKRLCRH